MNSGVVVYCFCPGVSVGAAQEEGSGLGLGLADVLCPDLTERRSQPRGGCMFQGSRFIRLGACSTTAQSYGRRMASAPRFPGAAAAAAAAENHAEHLRLRRARGRRPWRCAPAVPWCLLGGGSVALALHPCCVSHPLLYLSAFQFILILMQHTGICGLQNPGGMSFFFFIFCWDAISSIMGFSFRFCILCSPQVVCKVAPPLL